MCQEQRVEKLMFQSLQTECRLYKNINKSYPFPKMLLRKRQQISGCFRIVPRKGSAPSLTTSPESLISYVTVYHHISLPSLQVPQFNVYCGCTYYSCTHSLVTFVFQFEDTLVRKNTFCVALYFTLHNDVLIIILR